MAFHSPSPRKMGREEENMKQQHQPWLVLGSAPPGHRAPAQGKERVVQDGKRTPWLEPAFPRRAEWAESRKFGQNPGSLGSLGRIQEVSSSFGPIAGACLEISTAGSCSGPSSCSHHISPFPSALPSFLSESHPLLSPHSTSGHHAGVDLCFSFPSALSLSSLVGPSPPGASALSLCPTEL